MRSGGMHAPQHVQHARSARCSGWCNAGADLVSGNVHRAVHRQAEQRQQRTDEEWSGKQENVLRPRAPLLHSHLAQQRAGLGPKGGLRALRSAGAPAGVEEQAGGRPGVALLGRQKERVARWPALLHLQAPHLLASPPRLDARFRHWARPLPMCLALGPSARYAV